MQLIEIFKSLIMERNNNIDPNLFTKLKDAGWYLQPTGWKSAGNRMSIEVPLEQAETITVNGMETLSMYSIRVPKSKLVDFEYIMNAIAKKDNVDVVYVNLAKYMDKLIKDNRLDVYPTSYGIGVVSIYSRTKKSDIENVEQILNDLGLIYTNEYSDAGWVYRFKVSKNAKNMEILNKLHA